MKLTCPLVGWLHLSSEEASRAREFLRLCNGEDAIDELGLGIIRDGFSDQFFPGTSTIMTEPRYLIFVPAMFRSLERAVERGRHVTDDLWLVSRQRQDQLRDVLAASYKGKRGYGVIGISKREPERYPSAIYWASLRTLGIQRFEESRGEADYLRIVRSGAENSRQDANDGDPVAEMPPAAATWDHQFPYYHDATELQRPNGSFRDGLVFDLSHGEAVYLKKCYLEPHARDSSARQLSTSLLAHLLRGRRSSKFEYPWDVSAPSELQTAVDDARRFSLFARGVTLNYQFHLVEARKRAHLETSGVILSELFETWWEAARADLLSWSLGDFFSRRARDLRAARGDTGFLNRWIELLRTARSPDALLRNSDVHQLIVTRELACKPTKARLSQTKALEMWNPRISIPSERFQFDYRSRIGSLFVSRILTGLRQSANTANSLV